MEFVAETRSRTDFHLMKVNDYVYIAFADIQLRNDVYLLNVSSLLLINYYSTWYH